MAGSPATGIWHVLAARRSCVPDGHAVPLRRAAAARFFRRLAGGDQSHCHSPHIIFSITAIFTTVRGATFTVAGERVVRRLRRQLFDAIQVNEIGFFDAQKTGELTNRLSSDTAVVQNAVTVNVSMGLRFVAQMVVCLIALFIISWKLTLVMLGAVPAVVLLTARYGRYIKRIGKEYQAALARAGDVATESIANVRTVRSFGMDRVECQRYGEEVEASYRFGQKKAWAYGWFAGGISFFAYGAITLVLWYGATLARNGELQLGTLTSFVLYTIFLAASIGAISGLFSTLANAAGSSERVFELIDRKAKIPVDGGMVPAGGELRGDIVFDRVNFAYPTRPDQPVLKNFSLHVAPNESVALVGPSGGGKTTVFSLIERFYQPADTGVASR